MKKILLTLPVVTILPACGNVTIDQNVLAHINEQCKDNGGIYEVHISKGVDLSFYWYQVYCKDGTEKVVMKEDIK